MPTIVNDRPDIATSPIYAPTPERRTTRGKLRIYFGASAGVGKTCAMLTAARKLQADGHELIVGVVETHGRGETAAMLAGMEILAPREVLSRGKPDSGFEFDLDGALARRPALFLMDELAHSNALGSRHPKRWQDVVELLEAGIDVFTTLDVQHLDSLNDVVGGITGIRVTETVPDRIFDEANEVVMVDIPVDELLVRFHSGKIYHEPQADGVSGSFFRKGNLIALRELALRRTAERIGDDVRAYRIEKSIDTIWKTGTGLLACIGPRLDCDHVVRSTARLAGQLGAGWHVIYVETPALQQLSAPRREQIHRALKMAEELGATTEVLAANDVAHACVNYARDQNLSRIILGRGHRSWPWRTPHIKRMANFAPDIDLLELGVPANARVPAHPDPGGDSGYGSTRKRSGRSYLWAAFASVATALAAAPLLAFLDLANIAMLFLLVVVFVAVRFGRGPSVLATCVSVLCFDFFFVPPRFTFAISDIQYLVTFTVMLAVGLITGHLTAGLRFQAYVASRREERARALYEFARELSGALQSEQVYESTQTVIQKAFRAKSLMLLPDKEGRLLVTEQGVPANDRARHEKRLDLDLGIAQWSFDNAKNAGLGTDTLPASRIFYLPLQAPMCTRGVLAIEPEHHHWILIPEQRQQLDTFAALAAIALERVHYIDVAQNALVDMESERLRNSLLAALSHDLRTPLTSLIGVSETLAMSRPSLSGQQLELAQILHQESLRMEALVSNLLDMARIQSGEVKFNLQWQTVEEMVGSALRVSQGALKQHRTSTDVAPNLPLLHYDAVLLERVLCNLLENAAKYCPPGSEIVVAAEQRGEQMRVTVYDNGPGLPAGREEILFDKFTRGERESAKPGVGLGLAICRAIIEGHAGSISACASPIGGAGFVFVLPIGCPPNMLDAELLDFDLHYE